MSQVRYCLDVRARRAEETRRMIQSQQPEMQEIRQRLLQRRASQGNQNAATAE